MSCQLRAQDDDDPRSPRETCPRARVRSGGQDRPGDIDTEWYLDYCDSLHEAWQGWSHIAWIGQSQVSPVPHQSQLTRAGKARIVGLGAQASHPAVS